MGLNDSLTCLVQYELAFKPPLYKEIDSTTISLSMGVKFSLQDLWDLGLIILQAKVFPYSIKLMSKSQTDLANEAKMTAENLTKYALLLNLYK